MTLLLHGTSSSFCHGDMETSGPQVFYIKKLKKYEIRKSCSRRMDIINNKYN